MSVHNQNPSSIIYSPDPHSDVVIKHSRGTMTTEQPQNDADGEQHCWSNQDWKGDNASQTGISPLCHPMHSGDQTSFNTHTRFIEDD